MLTRHGRRGLEVIEAAATLPLMLFILTAIINLGWLVYAQQSVQNAANYGARMGSTAQDCRSCTAVGAAYQQVNATGMRNASVSVLAPGGVVGSTLRIRVSAQVPNLLGPLAALLGGNLSQPFQVSAEATFRAEGW